MDGEQQGTSELVLCTKCQKQRKTKDIKDGGKCRFCIQSERNKKSMEAREKATAEKFDEEKRHCILYLSAVAPVFYYSHNSVLYVLTEVTGASQEEEIDLALRERAYRMGLLRDGEIKWDKVRELRNELRSSLNKGR
jgi:hypothetical protein